MQRASCSGGAWIYPRTFVDEIGKRERLHHQNWHSHCESCMRANLHQASLQPPARHPLGDLTLLGYQPAISFITSSASTAKLSPASLRACNGTFFDHSAALSYAQPYCPGLGCCRYKQVDRRPAQCTVHIGAASTSTGSGPRSEANAERRGRGRRTVVGEPDG